ncbi:MAG: glycosyltransferase family 4 protein [Spirochaetes bacterium]|nr:glycosyltransferase family 4 protein [Spirochaetota bacterium]
MADIKRIALIHPDLAAGGGAENLILWSCEELSRRGIQITVVSRTFPDPVPPYITPFYANIGLKVLSWPATARRLADMLTGFDAVILHNFPATLHYGFAAGRKHVPPALWYCHEPKRLYYGANAADSDILEIERRKKMRFDEMNTVRLEKRGAARVARIVGNSVRSALHASHVYHREAGVVYPGLPERMLAAKPSQKENYFLYIGRLHEIKNVYAAILGFHAFLAHTKRKDIKLVIVGDGPESGNVRMLLQALSIADNVDMKGYVPTEKAAGIVDRALAVLNVPRNEPFGLITLEAWARHTVPIVAEDAGSAAVAEDGVDALTVNARNPLAVARAMERIASNPAFARSLAHAGHAKLRKSFLIAHHVDGLLSELHSAVGNER